MKLLNFENLGVVASCQKLGIILENKVIKKLMLSKNVNNKKCAPKFVFFNDKKKLAYFIYILKYTLCFRWSLVFNFLVWLLAHLHAQPVDHYWNGFVQNCIHFQILTNSSNEWIFSHPVYNIIQFCCNIWIHNHPYTSERTYWDPALLSSICKAIWSVQKSWNSVSTFYIEIRSIDNDSIDKLWNIVHTLPVKMFGMGQNFDPSLLTNKLWHVFMGMKQKFFWKKKFKMAD